MCFSIESLGGKYNDGGGVSRILGLITTVSSLDLKNMFMKKQNAKLITD